MGIQFSKSNPSTALVRRMGREAIKNPLTFERKKMRGWTKTF
jgi:hypothetical protein